MCFPPKLTDLRGAAKIVCFGVSVWLYHNTTSFDVCEHGLAFIYRSKLVCKLTSPKNRTSTWKKKLGIDRFGKIILFLLMWAMEFWQVLCNYILHHFLSFTVPQRTSLYEISQCQIYELCVVGVWTFPGPNPFFLSRNPHAACLVRTQDAVSNIRENKTSGKISPELSQSRLLAVQTKFVMRLY